VIQSKPSNGAQEKGTVEFIDCFDVYDGHCEKNKTSREGIENMEFYIRLHSLCFLHFPYRQPVYWVASKVSPRGYNDLI
jgi:hypothetical protein